MPIRIAIAAAAVWLVTLWSTAAAVIIFPKGGGDPIKGYLVRETASAVVVAVLNPDGTTTERLLGREQIDDMLISVSPERLAGLKPDNPQAYRDYAEELAEKSNRDPDAGVTALRLYLIAAHLDPDRLGRSCLLGMASLARSPTEKRKFLAKVYLLDPDHDARMLKSSGDTVTRGPALAPGAAEDLTEALRSLRSGQHPQALMAARRETVKPSFKQIDHFMSFDEFSELCTSRKKLTPGQLRRILLAELSLIRVPEVAGDLPKRDAGERNSSWSQIMATAPPHPVPSLRLETITEFDPTQCEYRDGKWVRP